ncbi:MAG: hypothetical protein MUP98_07940 [Candidatus Aminicenantes bacterium]|nr:hypothetical protein [Candidatus Aminicenantes bacterium]
MMEKSVWRTSGHGSSLEESEDGNRASFSRWEKRSVILNHFTELVLEITVLEMLSIAMLYLTFVFKLI